MRRLFGIGVALLLFVGAADAIARPGGGSSFSGGSRSGSSSSGSRSYGGSSSSSSGSRSYGGSSSSTSSSSGSRSSSWGGSSSTTSSSGTHSSSWGGSSSSTSGSTYGGSYSSSSSSSGDVSTPDSPHDRSFGRALVGVAFALLAIIVILILIGRHRQRAAWITREEEEERAEEQRQRYASIEKALAAARASDDAFSYVLFEDFLYALYAEAHAARGTTGGLSRLSSYLSMDAVATYAHLPKRTLDAVVIGGMRVDNVEIEGDHLLVDVVFVSNVSELDGEVATAWFMEERWRLVRSTGAQSRAPEKARVIACPGCGAPLDKMVGGECGYCQTSPGGGAMDWYVASIEVLAREARAPMLTGTTEEVGTDLPTVVAPNTKGRLELLRGKDPAFTWPAFVARVERTFSAFHASWCAQDLDEVRPYLSDNLFDLQRYWVDAYKRQHLRNLTKDARIVTVHLARVVRDKYFDAITVRVFASCIDYTVNDKDEVVGGRKNAVREYSEYWTFIRGVGKTGTPHADGACPSCGAPLSNVNMAGTCTHCNAKVTSGEFDWVLSRIEQDEVYEVAA